MAEVGRPRIEINWDEFDKLCGIQATRREIAAWFECSEDTIENAVLREKRVNFSSYYEQKSGRGKISLRRKQFEAALKGDRVMLIWLGKQYLDQAEKMNQTQAHSGTLNLSTELKDRVSQLKERSIEGASTVRELDGAVNKLLEKLEKQDVEK